MNALCPCALDELDTVCRLEPQPASHAFPSMLDASEPLRWLQGSAELAGMPAGLRLDAGWDPLPVSRPPALLTEHVDERGRTRLGTAVHRRHMPSWLSSHLGVQASALLEQEWSHPSLLNPFDFSRDHQEQLQNLAVHDLQLGLIASREGRVMTSAFRQAAIDLSYANEDLERAEAELKSLRTIDSRALEMSWELSSSDEEEEAHALRVDLRREKARVETLQASNTRLQAQLRAALQ
jgi:hypothetical protein